MKISHIKNIERNAIRLIAARVLISKEVPVQRMSEGQTNMRVRTVERALEGTGVTVAEIMLAEGVETEWYKDAKAEYSGANLQAYREERGLTPHQLARKCGLSEGTIKSYEKNQIISLEALQRLADALRVEVADMFLPPEGGE